MTPIYHITHLDNLPGIITAGCLWCDAQRVRQGFTCTNIGLDHIKERRLRRPVPVAAKGMLGEYVPFNFCPRSVMLCSISHGHMNYSDGQKRVIHLVSSVERAAGSGRPCAFSDRHAELRYAVIQDDLEQLNTLVDWSVIRLQYWASDDDTKQKKQAEFLVHDWFPWTCFHRIGVHNRQIATEVEGILAAAEHRPAVTVEPTWYY